MLIADGAALDCQEMIKKSYKTFVFVQPNSFPMPWGSHANFQCHCPDEVIDMLNGLDNVFYWNFIGMPSNPDISFYKWKKEIHQVPTAYDSISYKNIINDDYIYDVCYIGGYADNGFNEKYKIMLKYFSEFRDS